LLLNKKRNSNNEKKISTKKINIQQHIILYAQEKRFLTLTGVRNDGLDPKQGARINDL